MMAVQIDQKKYEIKDPFQCRVASSFNLFLHL